VVTEILRDSAFANAMSSVGRDKRLPHKVFVGRWEGYLFFEPDMMFDTSFIEAKNVLMGEESASVIALVNLGNDGAPNHGSPRAIFLERDTTSEEYVSKLVGDGSPMNWMFLMDRYVCASEKGNWSIYCEKEDDVAIFGFRGGLARTSVAKVERLLKAKSIKSLCSPDRSEIFDFGKLVPRWRSTLKVEYGP
jgi:hypothetical protein